MSSRVILPDNLSDAQKAHLKTIGLPDDRDKAQKIIDRRHSKSRKLLELINAKLLHDFKERDSK
jgi:hypothetical protein